MLKNGRYAPPAASWTTTDVPRQRRVPSGWSAPPAGLVGASAGLWVLRRSRQWRAGPRSARRVPYARSQLEMLDADQQELSQAPEGGREAVRARLLARWNLQLAALLDLYPDAGEDLLALIEELAGSEGEGSGGHTVSAFGNVASQVVQAGGDVHTGGGDISFTPPAL